MAETINIGDTFRSIIGDSNALWSVVRAESRDSYLCEVLEEEIDIGGGETIGSDDAGTQRVFLIEQILRARALSDIFSEHAKQSDDFYDSLAIDRIVHYSSRRGAFVRCRVVDIDALPADSNDYLFTAGDKVLSPIALVGEWPDYEIGRRRPDGAVDPGYAWRQFVEKKQWLRPSSESIFEFGKVTGADPSGLLPLTLDDNCFDPGTKYFRVSGVSFRVEATDEEEARRRAADLLSSVEDLTVGGVVEFPPTAPTLSEKDKSPEIDI